MLISLPTLGNSYQRSINLISSIGKIKDNEKMHGFDVQTQNLTQEM